jgi:hypothetical protein
VRTLLKLALVSLLALLPFDADAGRWIVVVAPELSEAVEPLCQQRRAEGWDVTVFDAALDRTELIDNIFRFTQSDEPCALVLVGDVAGTSTGANVASGKGTQSRMKGKFSDRWWATADGRLAKSIPTGRLPARSPEEASVIIRKILGWPEQARTIGPFPCSRFIVGNHGVPQPFGAMADDLVNRLSLGMARQLPARWCFEAMMHINGSPWQISSADLIGASEAMMKSPATVLAYMGHAGRNGAESTKTQLLTIGEWRSLPAAAPGIGLFFSCGCHTCDFDPKEEAFGVAAMRAPGGPAAVIGSQGETFAAMGYLALSGMLARMNGDTSPGTLGDFWEGAQQGLREGPIDDADFKMLDMADGSGGKLTLEAQRAEHLESWMLLGDPAMPLLAKALSIQLHANLSTSGSEVEITGELPPSLSKARLRLTVERHPGNIRTDLPEVPLRGDARLEATRKRRALSNDRALATTELAAEGAAFKALVPFPSSLSNGPFVIRASTLDGSPSAAGILQIPGKSREK